VERFWFDLALALGCSVWELKQRMPYAEFIQWIARYRLSPFGDERADLRAGIVASTMANCHATRRSKAFEPSDFMPKFEGSGRKGAERMTDSEMASKFKAFAQRHNAKAVARG
jgi:hypothetical protein